MLSIKEQWQKKPAMTRRDLENADAAAKLAVSQRRRRAMCESEGEALSEDDSMSSTPRESNIGNDALHVVARSLFSERIGSWQRWH